MIVSERLTLNLLYFGHLSHRINKNFRLQRIYFTFIEEKKMILPRSVQLVVKTNHCDWVP